MPPDPNPPAAPAAPIAAAARLAIRARLGGERALPVAVALALALLLLLGGLALHGTLSLRSDSTALQRGQRSLTALARLGAVVAEAEGALRGLAPTANPQALAPYRRARDESEAQLAELRSALAADDAQFNRLVALGALLSQRFDALVAALQANPRRAGAPPLTADASDDAHLHDRVQAALAELRLHAEKQLAVAQAHHDASASRALVSIALSCAAALGLVGFGGWRLQRERVQTRRAGARQQAALRAQVLSDRALQRVLDTSFDALFTIDAEGRFERTGAACERLWGWPAESLPGKPYVDLVLPEDRRKTEQAIEAAPAGPDSTEVRGRCRHRNGSTVHVLWRAQGLGSDGKLLCLVRDVGESEKLRAESSRLNEALQQSSADLAQAREQAESTARLRTAFMTHVGAGLRSSPVAIVSLAEMLQQGLGGPLNAEQQREMAKLLETARSLGARINALLDLALIDGRQLNLAREPFDLLEAVQKVASDMRGPAEKKGLRFDCQLADDLGYARGDAARVEQVLRALLEHVIRSTAAGPVALRAASPVGGLIRITISDGGPAMTPEEAAGLFDPFRAGGAGLMLALARQLAMLMGGEIRVGSEPGGANGFTLSLPADDLHQA